MAAEEDRLGPKCPNGHTWSGRIVGGGEEVVVDAVRILIAPVSCNQCGHVYGVITRPLA
ncbi:MAG: hypothetical protein ACRDGT_02470 [Candidatus Limnocylindria bacterium]